MKKYSFILAITALLLASLACQTVMGGDDTGFEPMPPVEDGSQDSQPVPSTEEESSEDSQDFDYSSGGESEFALTDDASNVVSVSGTVNYQTNLSVDEVLAFYRDTYGKLGYTEREILTTITDGVFNIVFDGDPSGQAIVIQGVDLGDGTTNVNISLQDI